MIWVRRCFALAQRGWAGNRVCGVIERLPEAYNAALAFELLKDD